MLYLLKDRNGKALLIAESTSRTEADRFGADNLPEFCGESIEIDTDSHAEAEEFWDVQTVRLVGRVLDPERPVFQFSSKRIILLGTPLIPEDIAAEGLLTDEDQRDIALDHIVRTCEIVTSLQIVKRG